MDSHQYLDYYAKLVDENKKARMVYGRLKVSKEDFLSAASLNYFEYEKEAGKGYPLGEAKFTALKRSIFLGSKEDDYGKKLRWNSEQALSKVVNGKEYSRNEIMNENPALYLNSSPGRTDILHEYFIPRKNFTSFIKELQRIVPKHKADLLNITIRNVYRDEDTFLHYADEEMFAFVMFFNQSVSEDAQEDMLLLTRELIDAANRLEGRYYLPYRLHATANQLETSYPMVRDFFAKKRLYDPKELFKNKFYEQYKHILGHSSKLPVEKIAEN
jgi:FAD/FMN-containing dehydrogenase